MRTRLLLLLAALSFIAMGAEAAQRWTRYSSSAGYSVDRPEGWVAVETGPPGVLHIVSGPCRATAVIICAGESQIVITSEATRHRGPARAKSCWSLTETRTDDELSSGHPRSIESTSHLTCIIGDRQFSIHESHWKGDKRAASYGRIAMRMAKSLRYPG